MNYRPRGSNWQAGAEQFHDSSSFRSANGQAAALNLAFVYTQQTMFDAAMSSYCRELIAGVREAMGDSSSSLSVLRGAEHADQDVMLSQQLDAGEYDGIILAGPEPSNGYLERLERVDVPLVVFNRPPGEGCFSCVTLDYYGGACQACRHLIDLGHKRIARIDEDGQSQKWLSRQIQRGFCDALRQHGMELAYQGVFNAIEQPETLEVACREAIANGATALAVGDRFAVRCADFLADKMGLRIPDDVSVIGFDALGLLTAQGLKLTSIGYDRRLMGRMAVQTISKLIRSRGRQRWLAGAVSTQLVVGQTTAPPRKG